MLQWGHALSGMDIVSSGFVQVPLLSASMGPCPFRHGYKTQSHEPSRDIQSFNGAMPFQAWIYLVQKRKTNYITASMGPCPFRHGYSQLMRFFHNRLRRFNGAMPFQAWICDLDGLCWLRLDGLQWGHALSGMDITPPRLPLLCAVRLQWGHALSGMDMRPA